MADLRKGAAMGLLITIGLPIVVVAAMVAFSLYISVKCWLYGYGNRYRGYAPGTNG